MSSAAKVAVNTAVVHEIFSGIQGEGVLVGYRQIFVRFHGCNLRCAFCDTPASGGASPSACTLEREAGSRELETLSNPLTADVLLQAIRRLQEGYFHHSISLTGGEPLLHPSYLAEFLPMLHFEEHRSYLETNGTLAEAMDALPVAPHYVAMDMKLPSVSGMPPLWMEHEAFLDAAVRRLSRMNGGFALPDRLQVKLVFGEKSLADIEQAAQIMARFRPDIPCILQPVTASPSGPATPSARTVLEAQRVASGLLTDVRVIPQTHVMMGQW